MGSQSWSTFHARLHQTIRQRHLFRQGDRLLLAVSGGQDSLCLMKLLHDLQPLWDWSLAIAHCNHRWREDSADNAVYVADLARQWQLPYWEAIAPIPPNSEAAARDWRYQALTTIAQQHQYTAIVTGHTASDRAETLLHHLLRGTGMEGLQSLAWQRPLTSGLTLVRPLLTTTRRETADFCQQHGLTIWHDSTNTDLRYLRNRLRLRVMPLLVNEFNPAAEVHLAQTADLLEADVACLNQLAEALWCQAVGQGNSEGWAASPEGDRLDRTVLREAPLALQRRVVRYHLRHSYGHTAPYAHVDKVVALLTAPNRSQTDPLFKGMIAYVDHPWIAFRPVAQVP